MRITTELLIEKGACSEQTVLFRNFFPDGIEPTEEVCVEHARTFNFAWAGDKFLSREGRLRFQAKRKEAYRAYQEAFVTGGGRLSGEQLTRQAYLTQAESVARAFARELNAYALV